jgi:hypothetical protein
MMRISFDLDDTLICRQSGAKYEHNLDLFSIGLWLNEPLRLGTRFLIRYLQQDGHEIWIYTSSYRQPFTVKLWLKFYGIKVANIVNQRVHDRYTKLKNSKIQPSKNPKLFDIDLHIDDSIGVRMEGDRYGFKVLVIEPNDLAWVNKVIEAVNAFND